MAILYVVLAVVLLSVVLVDIFWTALWADGAAGPLSSRSSSLLWRGLRRVGGRGSRAVNLAGPVILASTLLMWILLLWAGWVFVFAADPDSLRSTTDSAVTLSGRLYFVAYSMFTLGNGDFVPREGWAQLATTLATGTGMVVVTLSITYLLSVVQAVTQKRSFAASVTALGKRGEDIVRLGWDGSGFHSLEVPMSLLGSELSLLAEQHKAYPVLHYYHSQRSEEASTIAVAVLDDALTLLEFGVASSDWNRVVVASARSSVDDYLRTLKAAFFDPAPDPPPSPDLELLRSDGIPTVSDETFAAHLSDLAERRRRLLALVRADAREWPGSDGDTTRECP